MNPELKNQLEILTIEIHRQHKRYRSSFRNVIIFCVIILVFFSLYAALLSYKIRELATPSTIALLIAEQFREAMVPDLKKNLKTDMRPFAKDLAQSSLAVLPVIVPLSGNFFRDTMEQDLTRISNELGKRYTSVQKQEIDRILRTKAPVPVLATDAAEKIAASVSGEEVKKIVNTYFSFSLGHFCEQLRSIRRKAPAELSRKEACQRDLILCWLFLSEKDRYKDTRYTAPLFELTGLLLKTYEEASTPAKKQVLQEINLE